MPRFPVRILHVGLVLLCLMSLGSLPARAQMGGGFSLRILGGELGNSSASNVEDLKAIFPKLAARGLNTVLVPVSWELIEPEEGHWQFDLLAGTLREARKNGLHLVLLWFGAWKNSMSSYVPAWVKRDSTRFPRAEVTGGKPIESLSVFSPNVLDADRRAFVALMRELKRLDAKQRTVLMVQVENEVAMVDEAMDRSAVARKAWEQPVPPALVSHLEAKRESLRPELLAAWKKVGNAPGAPSANWGARFGTSPWAEEVFIAWHYGRYVEELAKAGKAEYALPMFVNAALKRPGYLPGKYPSGGPVPHLYDVWKAAAPSIDLLAPDVYFGRFDEWCGYFQRPDNVLFVPEIKNDDAVGAHALFAFGRRAIGFSPFAIETSGAKAAADLARVYALMRALGPLADRPSAGVLVDREAPAQSIALGGHVLQVKHEFTWSWAAPANPQDPWPKVGGLILNLGPDEYLIIGAGFIVTFAPDDGKGLSGLERVDLGDIRDGRFVATRRLNGDETHQGRHVRLPSGDVSVQRVKLYRY